MRSHCTTQAMSDAVAAQKQPGPTGSPVFGPLLRCSLALCRSGHTAFVAPCPVLKPGTPNSLFYPAATPLPRRGLISLDVPPGSFRLSAESPCPLRLHDARPRNCLTGNQQAYCVWVCVLCRNFSRLFIKHVSRQTVPERASGEPNRHGFVRCSDMFGSSPSADFRAGEIKRPAQEAV